MPLLLDRTGRTEDRWTPLADDGAMPDQGAVIVPLERLDEAIAMGPRVRIGLSLPNDAGVEPLVARFPRIALIAIRFPSFADGRGFSLAARLRALGFAGTLRATGPVIADQFRHLLGVGFDEVEVTDEIARRQPPEQWQAALGAISRGYQRAGGAAIADARRAHA